METELIVVIPSYNEVSLIPTLHSIEQNSNHYQFEVIILFNNSDTADVAVKSVNLKAYHEVLNSTFRFNCLPIYVDDIPAKQAGVGLARKIGMDEAAQRFKSIDKNGIIACLDADCTVADNYIDTIVEFFLQEHDLAAASIHYEHPFPEVEATKQSIIDYELHLRYHIDFQKWLGLPYAYQTVGSSMAVKSIDYTKQGGMNKRKAGEDFYFIHKFAAIERLGEIKNTMVFPSARISHRVPFGTGKAIFDMSEGKDFGTYHYQSYLMLQPLMNKVKLFYEHPILLQEMELNAGLEAYLTSQDFNKVIQEIKDNTTSFEAFYKRFFQWFNAFRLMKYLHFMRDHYFENIEAKDGAAYLYNLLTNSKQPNWNAEDYLLWFRAWDKK
ncbi:MAG: glycosyltransferase family A protein [Chitinophagales bacterium]